MEVIALILEILMIISMVLILIYIIEYNKLYNKVMGKFDKLSVNELRRLGFQKEKSSDLLYNHFVFVMNDYEFHVNKRKFTLPGHYVCIELYKKQKKLCNYAQLSKHFRKQVYISYLAVKYSLIRKWLIKDDRNIPDVLYELLKEEE